MKLIDIKKIYSGSYLTFYKALYINLDNKIKEYEFVSRNNNLTIDTFKPSPSNGIGMVIYNNDLSKILLLKEFRPACNNYVYSFPSGLRNKDEDIKNTVKRELKEETGLEISEILSILPLPYSAQGISDELMNLVIAKASGNILESDNPNEEIKASFYTKDEIRNMFNDKDIFFSVRTQMFLYDWINK